MDFPTIHTNFWDAVIAIPILIILTQLIKISFKPPAFLAKYCRYFRLDNIHFHQSQRASGNGNLHGVLLWIRCDWELCFFEDFGVDFSGGEGGCSMRGVKSYLLFLVDPVVGRFILFNILRVADSDSNFKNSLASLFVIVEPIR